MKEREIVLTGPAGRSDYKKGSVLFIGTATVLIECAGFTLLTDPNFVHRHEKVPLGYGLEAERLTDPALEIGDLPALDCVVLSHFHGDHFDQVAERELPKDLLIATPPQAEAELRQRGFTNVTGLETWETLALSKAGARLTIKAMPGKHGPGVTDLLLPDVMGSVLEFENAEGASLLRLYISGDTLVIDELNDVRTRGGDIDLALLHLGGTRVMGILVTMDDKQGVRLMEMVRPQMTVPIHYNDYDVFKSPLSDFQQRVREAGYEDHVRYLSHGERFEFDVPWPAPEEPSLQWGDGLDYETDSATGRRLDGDNA